MLGRHLARAVRRATPADMFRLPRTSDWDEVARTVLPPAKDLPAAISQYSLLQRVSRCMHASCAMFLLQPSNCLSTT